jgi:hypothetical protein
MRSPIMRINRMHVLAVVQIILRKPSEWMTLSLKRNGGIHSTVGAASQIQDTAGGAWAYRQTSQSGWAGATTCGSMGRMEGAATASRGRMPPSGRSQGIAVGATCLGPDPRCRVPSHTSECGAIWIVRVDSLLGASDLAGEDLCEGALSCLESTQTEAAQARADSVLATKIKAISQARLRRKTSEVVSPSTVFMEHSIISHPRHGRQDAPPFWPSRGRGVAIVCGGHPRTWLWGGEHLAHLWWAGSLRAHPTFHARA